ncbi:MAG: class I SAM-dependent methyltransferase [Pirellulaceae bacterium]|nr:class I SAM-dependent methyltransferase [Pirellulaceae bacterium]
MSQSPQFQWSPDQYSLLDFGAGRKLERFGNVVLDRPCPAALVCGRSLTGKRAASNSAHSSGFLVETDADYFDWERADVRLDNEGKLLAGRAPADGWQCHCGPMVFRLKLTPFGHVGLFPEQLANWQWLTARCAQYQAPTRRDFRALNLFAYTGGTTMCLATAGARVVHVDASAPAVKWARANAQSSRIAESPIHWIVDDARKFVSRELRRGNHYDVIVLDPPSFGHGAGGERFSIEAHLPELLDGCLQLLAPAQGTLLMSAHCELPTPASIADWIRASGRSVSIVHDRLLLKTQAGKSLDAGFYIRAVCGDSR